MQYSADINLKCSQSGIGSINQHMCFGLAWSVIRIESVILLCAKIII
jgi:hypothetical protein